LSHAASKSQRATMKSHAATLSRVRVARQSRATKSQVWHGTKKYYRSSLVHVQWRWAESARWSTKLQWCSNVFSSRWFRQIMASTALWLHLSEQAADGGVSLSGWRSSPEIWDARQNGICAPPTLNKDSVDQERIVYSLQKLGSISFLLIWIRLYLGTSSPVVPVYFSLIVGLFYILFK